MDLHELSKKIVNTRDMIMRHEGILNSSLVNTRDALIAPILETLGWDTANPDQYVGEYRPSQGPTICALMAHGNGAPTVLLVTKRLGELINAYEINQATTVAYETGTEYVGGTNGAQWRLYRDNNLVMEVDVTQGTTEAIAAALTPLWKDAMAGTETIPIPTPTPTPHSEARKTLATLTGDDPLPAVMTFPNGKEHQVTYWKQYLVGVARWLYDTGIVAEAKIMAQAGQQKGAAMTIPAPEKLDERKFREQHTNVYGQVWIRTCYNRGSIIKASLRLLSDEGVDPEQVKIDFHEA